MKVVITGGGTGGHVFPGLVLARALRSEEVVYAGSSAGFEKREAERAGLLFHPITARQLAGRGILKKISSLGFLLIGFFQALFFLKRFRPRVVVGTGGYVSAPVLLAANALRIPTLVMEQNLFPGRTTRFFSRLAAAVLVSFEESGKYFPPGKAVVTGNPVREGIGSWPKREAREKLGLSPDRPVILVTGASQGSRAINRCVLGALPLMASEPWQILHLTGENHYAWVEEESGKVLESGNLFYKAFPFVDEMGVMYGAADLVMARGGATSMAEILLAGKPSIIIPYPFAADNHQELNARWLEEKGGCAVVLEENLSPRVLYETVKAFLADPEKLGRMGEKAKEASRPDALDRIVAVIRDVAGEKNH